MDGVDAAGACRRAFELDQQVTDAHCARPKRQSCRRRFRSLSDRSSITCGRLSAAIPLPKRVSPPVTEVGSSGLTKLLISRKNELGLRGSPRGGPSECRGCNQRGQRETCDKCLHDTSPCLGHRHGFVLERGGRLAVACSRPSPPETASGRCLFRPERVQSGMRGSFCAVRQ